MVQRYKLYDVVVITKFTACTYTVYYLSPWAIKFLVQEASIFLIALIAKSIFHSIVIISFSRFYYGIVGYYTGRPSVLIITRKGGAMGAAIGAGLGIVVA